MRIERIGKATLYCGDCLEILPTLDRVDAAVTGPPYNVGKNYGTHDDAMPAAEYVAWLTARWHALPTDTLVYTPGDRHFWDTPRICADAGFQLGRMLAWHKREFAGDLFAGGPAMCWEPIIWAFRDGKAFNKIPGTLGRDHLTVNATHGNPYAKLHPCPKPIEVARWLVGLFTVDSALDPFMGSGTLGVAAIELGRSFIGIELDPRFFDVACERISRAQPGMRIPPAPAPLHPGLI